MTREVYNISKDNILSIYLVASNLNPSISPVITFYEEKPNVDEFIFRISKKLVGIIDKNKAIMDKLCKIVNTSIDENNKYYQIEIEDIIKNMVDSNMYKTEDYYYQLLYRTNNEIKPIIEIGEINVYLNYEIANMKTVERAINGN